MCLNVFEPSSNYVDVTKNIDENSKYKNQPKDADL